MVVQRESDSEPEETDSINELPVVLPKTYSSQAKLDHLARARARKAELAVERAAQRAAEREETAAISKGVKKVKDPQAREVIKKEILKATALKQPKVVPAAPAPAPTPAPIQKARKQPQIIVEESEPEVIIVKRPKKKIVVEQSETEQSEVEVKPKSRRTRKPRPVETESEYESEYEPPPPVSRRKLQPPTAYQPPAMPQFRINF